MSRTTRNWIIALILIPAAAYGVAKLAVWYSVKDTLSGVQDSLSPVASLEYSRILSPVFGPFGAAGIRIKPHIFDDEITIGSAMIQVDDPVEKYNFLRAAMGDTIPTKFKFSLNRARMGLDGEMAAWLDENSGPASSVSGGPTSCATGAAFSIRDIKRMGYEELAANIAVDYEYDRRRGGLIAYAKISLEEMFEIALESRIPAGEIVFDVDRMQGMPRLSDLTISFKDIAWASRFNSYCAEALGITEKQYVEKRMQETRMLFALTGFEPSEELMSALKKLTTGTGELTLSFNPRDPVALTNLGGTDDPGFLIDKLGLEVLVDGDPLQSLGAVKQAAPEEEPEQQQVVDETYKPTPVPELPQYLKSRVRIFTSDGKMHEGHLDGVEASKLVLTRHLAGGSVTFEVARGDVKRILVLRP